MGQVELVRGAQRGSAQYTQALVKYLPDGLNLRSQLVPQLGSQVLGGDFLSQAGMRPPHVAGVREAIEA